MTPPVEQPTSPSVGAPPAPRGPAGSEAGDGTPPVDGRVGASVRSGGTGHPAVDDVLDSLAGLEERPPEEHVAAFTAAHERLRSILDNPDGNPDSNPDSNPVDRSVSSGV